MKISTQNTDLENAIFSASKKSFSKLALDVFTFQYRNNLIYQQYCNHLQIRLNEVNCIEKIPFLPIQFFKSQDIKTTQFKEQIIFESSGTTQSIKSKHFVKDINLYKKSFLICFEKFYGSPTQYCILGLLPSYLEQKNSSLILMVSELIAQSKNTNSGFYLHDFEKLYHTILYNEQHKIPTILFGVTYALLHFAEKYAMQLKYTFILETGGMKGRSEELTKYQIHQKLNECLGTSVIHAEYGMTELLSQAYSKGNGLYLCPPWMKILIRDNDDPFLVNSEKNMTSKYITGVVNIIDLANLYSCSFIATDDLGMLYSTSKFELLGRIDNSDIRGCSLLAL